MAKAVQLSRSRRFGGINGLVHAAGLAGDAALSLLQRRAWLESERQF